MRCPGGGCVLKSDIEAARRQRDAVQVRHRASDRRWEGGPVGLSASADQVVVVEV